MKTSIATTLLMALLATGPIAQAAGLPTPPEAEVVQGQGAFAQAQLQMLAMFYSNAPAAAAKEAFASGNAQIDWRHYSPAMGGVSRGPTLSESIGPLLANIRAAADKCPAVEGPCQDKAWAWAKAQSESIRKSAHPGKALASTLEEISHGQP